MLAQMLIDFNPYDEHFVEYSQDRIIRPKILTHSCLTHIPNCARITHMSSINSKSILARALATENIRVEHNPTAHTAMFDVGNRVLILPVWENMSDSLYDMFVGHEVGHALFTPHNPNETSSGAWIDEAERIGGNIHAAYVQDLFNIVEDVRIEKKIKNKFPGMRRDFVHGYRELIERNFFGTKDKKLSSFSFPDRINLHFKGGSELLVEFNEEEQIFVNKIDSVETFEEMVNVSDELFKYLNGKKENGDNQNNKATHYAPSDGKDEGGNTQTVDVSNSTNNNYNSPAGSFPSNKTAGNGNGGNLPNMITQKNFEENRKNIVNENIKSVSYVTLPIPNMKRIILPYTETNKILTDHFQTMGKVSTRTDLNTKIESKFDSVMNNTKMLVGTLVKQFDMKKAADIHKRTAISRTGKIDCNRIYKYKVSDDIFARYAKIAEGKNHGLVMYVDWSSSMANSTEDVLIQILMMCQFCKRMNIPFDVYLFSTNYPILNSMNSVSFNSNFHNQYIHPGSRTDRTSIKSYFDNKIYNTQFALLHIVSSDMKNDEFKYAMKNLFFLGQMITCPKDIFPLSSYASSVPSYFGQSGTPLDSTILSAMTMVPEFQKKHGVEIVNTIFLTDGGAGDSMFHGNGYNSRSYVRSPINNKEYDTTKFGNSTDAMLYMFRDITKSSAIGFFITNGKHCSYINSTNVKQFKDEGFLDISGERKIDMYGNNFCNHGYDRLFILPCKQNVTDEFNTLDNLEVNASFVKIRNTFMNAAEKRGSSRSFLNRFADVIAVGTKR